MSQSDYLKHKKIATELKVDHQSNHPAVFDAKQYMDYRSYAVTKDITNTKTTYNKVVPSTTQILFDVEEIVTNCPSFECTSTSGRPNRIAHTGRMCDVHPLTWNQINNKDVYEMNKILNKTNYDETNCCGNTNSENTNSGNTNNIQCLSQVTNNVQMQNPYKFNNIDYSQDKKIGVKIGTYTLTGITNVHPIGFVISGTDKLEVTSGTSAGTKTVESISVEHYYGTVVIDVKADFGTISYNCYNHGYMGGQERLTFSNTC